MGKALVRITFILLLAATIHFQDFWNPTCTKPFVEIGGRCYFFSSNKAPTGEFYRVTFKNRVFSVPVVMRWTHANLGCESFDSKSRLLTVRTVEEMKEIVDYLKNRAHYATHSVFWCGAHRGRLSKPKDADYKTLYDFYWHTDFMPMNYTNFVRKDQPKLRFGDGFCVYMEFTGTELVMGVDNCDKKLAFVCEWDPDLPTPPAPYGGNLD